MTAGVCRPAKAGLGLSSHPYSAEGPRAAKRSAHKKTQHIVGTAITSSSGEAMECDQDKIDEVVLALLYLTLHDKVRAWKGHDWDTLDNLHAKGYISNPATSAKSVVFTEEGLDRARQLFEKHFGKVLRS
jgi:hypothetical protein